MAQSSPHVAVIGAGIGGLVASLELARRGYRVTLFEIAANVGGKAQYRRVAAQAIAMGPTVLTMPWVFEEIFAAAGSDFGRICRPQACLRIARHFWDQGPHLDLYPDRKRNIQAISAFAGPKQGRAYAEFAAHTQMVYESMRQGFLGSSKPNPVSLSLSGGIGGLARLLRSRPMHKYWSLLCEFFDDPRLRQLFGRYATYAGSNPFQATAALALISHVEECGVWQLEGGMPALAAALAQLAQAHGVHIATSRKVDRLQRQARGWLLEAQDQSSLTVDAVVYNGEIAALERGALGSDVQAAAHAVQGPALGALTWAAQARFKGRDLAHHNVFFGSDYAQEFEQIFAKRSLPEDPTVYLCAQQRQERTPPAGQQPQTEPVLLLINAAAGQTADPEADSELGLQRLTRRLQQCGLQLELEAMECWTPADYAQRFPASAGAVYGPPMHGWRSSFTRPTARSAIPGFYLCGGGVHPGPGLPMVALSGRFAAQALHADLGAEPQ